MNRYYKNGELKDNEIIASLKKAAEDYENGEISEVKDVIADIWNAISEWEKHYEV